MKLSEAENLDRALKTLSILRDATVGMVDPAVDTVIKVYGRDPFLILISCLLSLRTKDGVSLPASQRLFQFAKSPKELLDIPLSKLEKTIYPVGFYRVRAKQLHAVCRELLERFEGLVPNREEELLSLPGVGRKTAALVLGTAFGVPAICVDTHVHRISNRLGLITTQTPHETEKALKEILPEKYWIECNRLLVMWGQNVCVPISPFCSKCAMADLCPRVGVKKYR